MTSHVVLMANPRRESDLLQSQVIALSRTGHGTRRSALFHMVESQTADRDRHADGTSGRGRIGHGCARSECGDADVVVGGRKRERAVAGGRRDFTLGWELFEDTKRGRGSSK
jgi:hypothetical protein